MSSLGKCSQCGKLRKDCKDSRLWRNSEAKGFQGDHRCWDCLEPEWKEHWSNIKNQMEKQAKEKLGKHVG